MQEKSLKEEETRPWPVDRASVSASLEEMVW